MINPHGVLHSGISLVEQFHSATLTSPGLMYAIATLAASCCLALLLFAFRAEP